MLTRDIAEKIGSEMIEEETGFCFDIADENCQIVSNVKHMSWFKNEVIEQVWYCRNDLSFVTAMRKEYPDCF